jgi:hypothetical protein
MRRINEAAERVRTWDRLWGAYVHALQTGDAQLLDCARRAIAAFDREHGLRPLRVTRGA